MGIKLDKYEDSTQDLNQLFSSINAVLPRRYRRRNSSLFGLSSLFLASVPRRGHVPHLGPVATAAFTFSLALGAETPEELIAYLESEGVKGKGTFGESSDFPSAEDSDSDETNKIETLLVDGASRDVKKHATHILARRINSSFFKMNPFLREVLTTALVLNNTLMSQYIRYLQREKVLPYFESCFVWTAEMKAAILMRLDKGLKKSFFQPNICWSPQFFEEAAFDPVQSGVHSRCHRPGLDIPSD